MNAKAKSALPINKLKSIGLLFVLVSILGIFATFAKAQTKTAAGTVITNKATADFSDSTGKAQTTESNIVEVTVLPVYGFNIEPDNGKPPSGGAADNSPLTTGNTANNDPDNSNDDAVPAGNVVAFEYTIENDGNKEDVFDLKVLQGQGTTDKFDLTGVQIYTFADGNNNGKLDFTDKDGDGVFDLGEETETLQPLGNDTASISLAASDGTAGKGDDFANLVVIGTVPASQTGGDTAKVDLVATSRGAKGQNKKDPNVLYENSNISRVTVKEKVSIGIAKRVEGTPVNNGDGSYTVKYVLRIENLSNVQLSKVTVTDDLKNVFNTTGTTFSVDKTKITSNITKQGTPANTTKITLNNSTSPFNGDTNKELLDASTSTLAVGAIVEISFEVKITKPEMNKTYNNQATAKGTSPKGKTVGDYSDDGNEPDVNGNGDAGADPAASPTENAGSDKDDKDEDTPTPVKFTENASIGIAKALTGVTNLGNSEYNVAFTITIKNYGDVAVDEVQIVEDLNATFTVGNTKLIGITSQPVLRIQKASNTSKSALTLNTGFDGAGNTNLLTGGKGSILDKEDSATISFTVKIGKKDNSKDLTPGSYKNTATVSGTSPTGAKLTDDSQNGLNPDPNGNSDPKDENDPTPINIGENPVIGVAKAVGNAVDNGDGTYNITYVITVKNYGSVELSKIQVSDDLTKTFKNPQNPQPDFSIVAGSISSPGFAVDTNFDGKTKKDLLAVNNSKNKLAVNASQTITFTVKLTPNRATATYNNQAIAKGTSPKGTEVSDTSQNGTNPDNNGDNNPGNNSDPTPVEVPIGKPIIGVAKRVTKTPVENPANSGKYDIEYTIVVENLGKVKLYNVQVTDDLVATFGSEFDSFVSVATTGGLNKNPDFNGKTIKNLLTGNDTLAANKTATIILKVKVKPSKSPSREYKNQAIATATDPSGKQKTGDYSDDGSDPDPNGNGDAGADPTTSTPEEPGSDTNNKDEDTPTPVIIRGPSEMKLEKQQAICEDAQCTKIVTDKGDTTNKLTAEAGQFIRYTITGTASADIKNVVIQDIVPTPTEFVSATGKFDTTAVTPKCLIGTAWSTANCTTANTLKDVKEVSLSNTALANGKKAILIFTVKIP